MGVLESNGGRRPLCHVINVQIRPERKHIQTPMIIRIHLTCFLKVMVNEHLMSTNINETGPERHHFIYGKLKMMEVQSELKVKKVVIISYTCTSLRCQKETL